MRMGWLWIFPGIGALMLALAIGLLLLRLEAQTVMVAGQGTVVDVSGGCPTVEFSTERGEAVQFRAGVCSNPPSFDVGESVAVLYEPLKPDQAHLDTFMENWFASLVVGGIGSVFLLLGSLFVLPPLLARRRAAELRVSGTPVYAELMEVQRNEALSVNGRHPWKIVAQWHNPATQKVHLFSSENLWFDPSPYLKDKQMRVLIDPQKPKRYSMDVSFLPQLAD